MKIYGHIDKDGYLVSRMLEDRFDRRLNEAGEPEDVVVTIAMQAEELAKAGWKPVDGIDGARLDAAGEFESVMLQPYDNGDRISYRYITRTDRRLVMNAVQECRHALDATDYRVIKCYEAGLLGQPPPYSVEELHRERQARRDRINELETLLDSLGMEYPSPAPQP